MLILLESLSPVHRVAGYCRSYTLHGARTCTWAQSTLSVAGWEKGCGDYVEVNRTLFVEGAMFPGASIWLYANNDTFYSVAHSQVNFTAFTNAGGLATFNVYTRASGLNGHFLTNDPHLWGADVEAYIAVLP